MFKAVHPVCPVLHMGAHLDFWRMLGFRVAFASASPPEQADYAGVTRDGLELHLQTFAPEDLSRTQIMATRIEMTDPASLEALHLEWAKLISITHPFGPRPWGTCEFGFFDPVGTPFFFYVTLASGEAA